MNVKLRIRMHAHTRSNTNCTTPPNYPVVSVFDAMVQSTRSDTLYAVANFHSRIGNRHISHSLRKVANELKYAA